MRQFGPCGDEMARGRKLIAGNWKMNGLRADGVALAEAIAARAEGRIGALRPARLPAGDDLAAIGKAIAGSPVALGGQNCHAAENGACTGDVSAEMLKDAGCAYVIVGHSERRAIAARSMRSSTPRWPPHWRAGLVAILCVGETCAEREAGREARHRDRPAGRINSRRRHV